MPQGDDRRLQLEHGLLTPSIACFTRSSLMRPLRCKLLIRSSFVVPELRQAIFARPPVLFPRKKLRRIAGSVTVKMASRWV